MDDAGKSEHSEGSEAKTEPVAPPVYQPPVYVATPPRERPAGFYLLLGVNVLILGAVIAWVFYRSGQLQPAASAASARADEPTPPVGKGTVTPPDRGAAKLPGDGAAGKEGAKPAEPAAPQYDAATLEKIESTRNGISKVGVQVEVLRAVRGAYPTSNVAAFGRNRGIEALHQALVDAGRFKQDELKQVSTGDTDADGRKEILDPWGNPFLYFSNDDYASKQGWGKEAPAAEDAGAAKGGTQEGFRARSRFQLWSAGPNGKNEGGEKDDIVSWEIREKRQDQ